MGVLEGVKEGIEKVTGWKHPSRGDLCNAVKRRKPNSFYFKDDGVVPNNPKLPLILYHGPVSLADDFDPAAVFEELFAGNSWRNSWRNGVYDYVHYHSRAHEVLGVARGHARFASAANAGKSFSSKPAMWWSCRPGPATSALQPAKICSWLARMRPSAVMTNAAPSRRWNRCAFRGLLQKYGRPTARMHRAPESQR